MQLPSDSSIEAREQRVSPDVQIGPDVQVKCRVLRIHPGCSIGVEKTANFRAVAGVRIDCDMLELGPNTAIDRSVLMQGGELILGPNCRIGTGVTIRVKRRLQLGPRCQIGSDSVVEGHHIRIGRELWTGPHVRIGGGSCFEVQSELVMGYWCHLGMGTFINTARRVTIGNEVGIGTGSAIYTHGAYQSVLNGYPAAFAPVEIEDNCWIPGAVVNPGVKIGRGAVIGVGSVVTKDVPVGALAAGIPCRVIKDNAFPRVLSAEDRQGFFRNFMRTAADVLADFTGSPAKYKENERSTTIEQTDRTVFFLEEFSGPVDENRHLIVIAQRGNPGLDLEHAKCANLTIFSLGARRILGRADPVTEKVRDLLRRYGIRFMSESVDGRYEKWNQK